MSNELIFVLVFFWMVSATYVMVYHSKRWTLGLDIIIGAIILGPILALLIGDDEERIIKQKRKKEKESNDRHIGWFRTMGEINKQRTPTWFRTIPPPPPNRRPDIKKDFKFFRG
jgi:hypothetical protein